ncbi:unnamed protein product [Pleuronectes platessa]|uniref:Uncharacterized protein n=1 Tax=Pleuronectes platessa TaxID=8262 RepID=A0A9N7UAR2_PLEPL|nr:unnamed protein product [Pleuronectes platessa]
MNPVEVIQWKSRTEVQSLEAVGSKQNVNHSRASQSVSLGTPRNSSRTSGVPHIPVWAQLVRSRVQINLPRAERQREGVEREREGAEREREGAEREREGAEREREGAEREREGAEQEREGAKPGPAASARFTTEPLKETDSNLKHL